MAAEWGWTVAREEWFDVPHVAATIPEATLKLWSSATSRPALQLPPPNTYLPANVELHPPPAASSHPKPDPRAAKLLPGHPLPPTLLRCSPGFRLWHKQDGHFRVPKASVHIRLAAGCMYDSPRTAALTWLVAAVLEDAASEQLYMAQLGGLGAYSQPLGAQGFEVVV